ncbi:MAG TPA: sulfite oxidase [Ktedonobacterales bacterium]|nr:sulfite oxidase [Ktedonobacterales bacterium]
MGISTPKRSGLVPITSEPFNAEAPPKALQASITPTEQHYVRAHFAVPRHPGTLTIEGAVDRSLRLTLADVRALPATTLSVTLECAGNGRLGFQPFPKGEPWGWAAVSTAAWTGVPLQALLAQAQPRPEGRAIVFEGADHGPYQGGPDIPYTRALTRDGAERVGADIILAYEMNGEPLPAEYGAPLRLVVPGWYAMASVKWVQRIRVIPDAFSGEFQTHSYNYHWPDGTSQPVTAMRVRAQITDPLYGEALPRGKHLIRGWAWSGMGAVTRVEVGIDDKESWQPARLAAPVSPHAWQAWTFEWDAPEAGRYVIRARASDSSGAAQPDCPAWNKLGYGNNAVQAHLVDVS